MNKFIKTLHIDLLRRIEHTINDIHSYPHHDNLKKEFIPNTLEQFAHLKNNLQLIINSGGSLVNYHPLHTAFKNIHSYRYQAIKNYKEPEIFFNKIISQVYHEHRINALPPIISTTSNHHLYYWTIPQYDIIFLPMGEEESLLNLPDMYHEIGHLLYTMFEAKSSENSAMEIDRYFMGIKHQNKEIEIKKNNFLWRKKWIEEFTCDMTATYMVGSAYAWTYLKLLSNELGNTDIYRHSSTHPCDEARMRIIILMMDKLGLNEEKRQFESIWNSFLETSVKPKNHDFIYPPYIFKLMVDEFFEFYQNADLASVFELKNSTNSISKILNNAWNITRDPSIDYLDFEKQQIRNLKLKYSL